ncbi:MAG TPA: HAD family hydrolase [Gemmatimonadaceae bacterium]|nr:HAD family hydrolase [Gemmatimonadaceae bacterium]
MRSANDSLKTVTVPHEPDGMPPIAGVLFDLDDTLINRAATVDQFLVAHCDRVGLAACATAYSRRFHELDANGYADRDDLFTQLAAEFPGPTREVLRRDFEEHVWRACVVVPGGREVLDACRAAGHRVGVVTNGSAESQHAKLANAGLLALLDAVVISGVDGVAKPAREAFHLAASRLGIAPSGCVFVGDNPHTDVEGARRAGLTAAWFRGRLPWPSELPAPVHVITTLGAVPELLARLAHPMREHPMREHPMLQRRTAAE